MTLYDNYKRRKKFEYGGPYGVLNEDWTRAYSNNPKSAGEGYGDFYNKSMGQGPKQRYQNSLQRPNSPGIGLNYPDGGYNNFENVQNTGVGLKTGNTLFGTNPNFQTTTPNAFGSQEIGADMSSSMDASNFADGSNTTGTKQGAANAAGVFNGITQGANMLFKSQARELGQYEKDFGQGRTQQAMTRAAQGSSIGSQLGPIGWLAGTLIGGVGGYFEGKGMEKKWNKEVDKRQALYRQKEDLGMMYNAQPGFINGNRYAQFSKYGGPLYKGLQYAKYGGTIYKKFSKGGPVKKKKRKTTFANFSPVARVLEKHPQQIRKYDIGPVSTRLPSESTRVAKPKKSVSKPKGTGSIRATNKKESKTATAKKWAKRKLQTQPRTYNEGDAKVATNTWNSTAQPVINTYKAVKKKAHKNPITKKIFDKLDPVTNLDQAVGLMGVPANMVTQATEAIGGYGDKKWNWGEVLPQSPNSSGYTPFSFKDSKGNPMKTMGETLDIQNPYARFAVDLASDPATYLGVGLARKGVQAARIPARARLMRQKHWVKDFPTTVDAHWSMHKGRVKGWKGASDKNLTNAQNKAIQLPDADYNRHKAINRVKTERNELLFQNRQFGRHPNIIDPNPSYPRNAHEKLSILKAEQDVEKAALRSFEKLSPAEQKAYLEAASPAEIKQKLKGIETKMGEAKKAVDEGSHSPIPSEKTAYNAPLYEESPKSTIPSTKYPTIKKNPHTSTYNSTPIKEQKRHVWERQGEEQGHNLRLKWNNLKNKWTGKKNMEQVNIDDNKTTHVLNSLFAYNSGKKGAREKMKLAQDWVLNKAKPGYIQATPDLSDNSYKAANTFIQRLTNQYPDRFEAVLNRPGVQNALELNTSGNLTQYTTGHNTKVINSGLANPVNTESISKYLNTDIAKMKFNNQKHTMPGTYAGENMFGEDAIRAPQLLLRKKFGEGGILQKNSNLPFRWNGMPQQPARQRPSINPWAWQNKEGEHKVMTGGLNTNYGIGISGTAAFPWAHPNALRTQLGANMNLDNGFKVEGGLNFDHTRRNENGRIHNSPYAKLSYRKRFGGGGPVKKKPAPKKKITLTNTPYVMPAESTNVNIPLQPTVDPKALPIYKNQQQTRQLKKLSGKRSNKSSLTNYEKAIARSKGANNVYDETKYPIDTPTYLANKQILEQNGSPNIDYEPLKNSEFQTWQQTNPNGQVQTLIHPYGGRRSWTNPLTNQLNIKRSDALLAEVPHVMQNNKRPAIPRLVNDWFSDPYVTPEGQERQYEQEGTYENDAHAVLEPKVRTLQQQYKDSLTKRRASGLPYYATGGTVDDNELAKEPTKGGTITAISSDTSIMKGNTHEQGGIKADGINAEFENNETAIEMPDGTSEIMSEKLGFAKLHRPIAKRIGALEKQLNKKQGMGSKALLNSLRLEREKQQRLIARQRELKQQLNIV